jgi:hypothetical protein
MVFYRLSSRTASPDVDAQIDTDAQIDADFALDSRSLRVTSSFLPHLAVVFPEQSAFNLNRLTTAVPRFIEVHLDPYQIDVDISSLYDLHPHDTFFMVLDLITPCKLLGKLDDSASSFPASLLYQTTLRPAQITARVQALHPDVRVTSCEEITDHQLRDVTGHAILSS